MGWEKGWLGGERVVSGVRSTLAKELREAVETGNKVAVAALSRELLRTVDASVRLDASAGGTAGDDDESGTLPPRVIILEASLFERWRRESEGEDRIEVVLPMNGREGVE